MTIDQGVLSGLVRHVRSIYGDGFIQMHRPVFAGNEKAYLSDTIDSTFVSSVGERVDNFERDIARFMGAKHAIATVNGTAALHMALLVAGVKPGDEVISQALTFVATANATNYAGANPVFLDVERETLGLCPDALQRWLDANTELRNGSCHNRRTGARVAAVVPMHTFGIPCSIGEIAEICAEYDIALIEDAAESIGSFVGDRHTGTFGLMSTLSFNGNKVITTGGGGMIVTDDDDIAARVKHLTTTAKRPHAYEFYHDEVGYNYRLPNLNAALGCAQMEQLPTILAIKAEIAAGYAEFCRDHNDLGFISAPPDTTGNNWLNAVLLPSVEDRDAFLRYTNEAGVMTRPIWRLMTSLPMFAAAENDGLEVSHWLEQRIVNVPSSVPDSEISRVACSVADAGQGVALR